MKELFHKIAVSISSVVGSPYAFITALAIICFWAINGPIFHFSDTWQLIINTGTTIVTFLMVFIIQNTQSRDAKALHLKLDELIRSTGRARDNFIEVENLPDEELEKLHKEFTVLYEKYNKELEKRKKGNGKPLSIHKVIDKKFGSE
jgi:low affinity Fe/Cu permease